MPKKTGEVTLADFKKEAKKYNEKVKVTFEDGSYVYVYKYFSPKKIDECVMELTEYIAELQKKNIQMNDLDIVVFMELHIFKHFSSLKSSIPKEIDKKNEIFKFLTDGSMYKQVVDAFDDEQKQLVWKSLFDKFKKIQATILQNEEMRVKLLEQIENMNLEHKDFIKQTLLTHPETMGLPFADKLDVEGGE